MFKCRRKRGHQLNVDIRPVKKEFDGKNRIVYRIDIDGDLFWADSYDHALCTLLEILVRDEFSRGKIA